MILLFIGLVTGLVMGLTGAGGALIALPLFISFLSMTLKEASVLSLFAVVVASGMNFLFQRRHVDLRLSLLIYFPSIMGSYLATGLKDSIPIVVLKIFLILVALFALFGVWNPIRGTQGEARPHFFLSMVIGLILGVLTTFTGLGGGVLLLPILLNVYHHPYERAVASSLLIICLSSLTSLSLQLGHGDIKLLPMEYVLLLSGILMAAFSFSFIERMIGSATLVRLRQLVFSMVVLFALGKILTAS